MPWGGRREKLSGVVFQRHMPSVAGTGASIEVGVCSGALRLHKRGVRGELMRCLGEVFIVTLSVPQVVKALTTDR